MTSLETLRCTIFYDILRECCQLPFSMFSLGFAIFSTYYFWSLWKLLPWCMYTCVCAPTWTHKTSSEVIPTHLTLSAGAAWAPLLVEDCAPSSQGTSVSPLFKVYDYSCTSLGAEVDMHICNLVVGNTVVAQRCSSPDSVSKSPYKANGVLQMWLN